MIYYMCDREYTPGNDAREMLLHVEALQGTSLSAMAFMPAPRSISAVFTQQPFVITERAIFQERYSPESDIIVLPDALGHQMASFSGQRVVYSPDPLRGISILNTETEISNPLLSSQTLGFITDTITSKALLADLYPNKRCCFLPQPLRPYNYGRTTPASSSRLVVGGSENPSHLAAVYQILAAKAVLAEDNRLAGEWLDVGDSSAERLAPVLQESRIFLHLAGRFNAGRQALEALAYGNAVITYEDSFLSGILPSSLVVPYGDILAVVQATKRLLEETEEDPVWDSLKESRLQAHEEYGWEQFQTRLVAAWSHLLSNREVE